MPKKTVQKLEVVEIKTYKCSDGSVYDTEDAALSHEQFLKDCESNPLIASKIKELESRILKLEDENSTLSARITALEAQKSVSSFPWSKPNPDVSPWGPYQQPYNPMIPTPKLPAQPGNVVYEDKDHYQRVIMQENGSMKVTHTAEDDERAIKDGKTVVYAGHKRVVMDSPISENQEYNAGHTGLGYGEMEKRRMEWQEKNKK